MSVDISGVVSPQYCSATESAQSWSDIIQHGLRPQPSFARFLDLPKEIRFPIWTSIRSRDASLVAPVHSYFRSAHSGVGEASPHGYTFPALVRTHRTPILTIPALRPIVLALALLFQCLLPRLQNPSIRSSGLLDNKSCGVGRQSAYCTLAADRGTITLF